MTRNIIVSPTVGANYRSIVETHVTVGSFGGVVDDDDIGASGRDWYTT
jgi:hypothetical protein